MTQSALTSHIEAVQTLLDKGDIEGAKAEMSAATDRFLAYREMMSDTFSSAIGALTTQGERYSAPHPAALELIRLRKKAFA